MDVGGASLILLENDGEVSGRSGAGGGETDESGDERCTKRPRVGECGGGGLPLQSPHYSGVEVPLFEKKTERPPVDICPCFRRCVRASARAFVSVLGVRARVLAC